VPSFTLNRRLPAALTALAIVGALSFAAPAQADELAPTSASTDVVAAPAVDETVTPPPVEAVAEPIAEALEEPAEVTEPAVSETEPAETEPAPLSFARVSAPAFTTATSSNTGCLVAPTNVTIDDSTDLFYDSRTGGSSSLTTNGLEVAWHGPDLSQSKVAWYYATDFPLSELGDPTITYDVTSGASVGQNFTITDNGVWKGNIVKEPGIAGYWTTFSIPGLAADPTASYRKAIGSIANFIDAYAADAAPHDVRVVAIGGSGGSGSEGVGVVHSQSAGCYDLTFAAPPVPTNVGCTTTPNSVVIDQASDLVYDSRTGGSSSVTAKGLEVAWHGPDLSQSKVAWYYPTDFPLSELGTPAIGYTQTSGASVGQNFTVTVDGVWKGNIVKEPGIADYWTTFSIPGLSADPAASYRKAVGTIDDFLAAYWADSRTHDVRVVAIGGSGGSGSEGVGIVKTQTVGCYELTFGVPAPSVAACLPANLVNVAVTTPSQLVYDSRTGGSSSVTAKGLEVAWHGPDLSQSKVAWYYPTNFPLSELGTPSIDYDVTSGASVGQNFTVTVDGVWKGNIVKEPGIADYWTTFSIPGMTADPTASYRKAIGTIQDFVNAYWLDDMTHDVRVVAIGGSGGSGSEGVGTVHSQTAGCYDLEFGVPAPVVAACLTANLVKVAVTTASQLTYDSRTGGSSAVTSNGLEVAWHGPDLSQSKVAWYYATDFPLYKLGTPSIGYTQTSGASVGQNFTVTVDGVWKGNIVKEPGIADYWTTFSIPGMSADPTASYRKAIGTIQDFVNAYWLDDMAHDVRVVAIGGSGGSGSEGVGTVKTQKAGCYELTYGIPAVVVAPPVTPPATGTTGTGGAAGGAAATTATPTPTASATPKPTPSATPAPSADETNTADELPTEAFGGESTGDAAPWWPWALGIAILLLLLLLWFLIFRRRRGNQS
jgi:predicted secreted protein